MYSYWFNKTTEFLTGRGRKYNINEIGTKRTASVVPTVVEQTTIVARVFLATSDTDSSQLVGTAAAPIPWMISFLLKTNIFIQPASKQVSTTTTMRVLFAWSTGS